MWFTFPEGTTSITVQQQAFSSEFKDDTGTEYFRAPDHFAPIILDLPGFKSRKPEGDGVPPDLPTSFPGSESALDDLGAQIAALKTQVDGMTKINVELTGERNKAVTALESALKKIAEFEKSGEKKS